MNDFTAQEKEMLRCEQAVIGIMLMEPEKSVRVYDTLSPSMFYAEPLGKIFKCCKGLQEQGQRADVATVLDKLGDSYKELVVGCAETVPSISGLDSYINSVMDSWRARTMRIKMNELCENGMDADSMTVELQKLLQKQEHIISHQREATNKPFESCLLEFVNWMQKPDTSIPTGYPDFDKVTGGLQRGCITVIAARPGCGKTTLGLQMATNIAHDHNVLYISLEMTAVQLTRNIVARYSGVGSQVFSAKKLTDDEAAKMAEATEYLYNRLKLSINDDPRQTVNDIETAIKAKKPEVVVIDHLRLLTPMNNRKNEFESSAENTHALKQLAKKYDINIIELVQAKRESEGRVPGMADLYGGAATEQDADMIIGICPESEYRNMDRCMVQVAVTKNRHGAGGDFEFVWDKPLCSMLQALRE